MHAVTRILRRRPFYSCWNSPRLRNLGTVSLPSYEPPSLPTKIFTNIPTKNKHSIFAVPLDAFPNPLFSMSKAEVRTLNAKELRHLLRIPCTNIIETDLFCLNCIAIVNDVLLADPAYGASLLSAVKEANSEMYELVFGALEEYFEKHVKRKEMVLLKFIDNPGGDESQRLFFAYLSQIMADEKLTVTEKSSDILQLAERMALTDIVNENPFLMTSSLYDSLLSGIDRKDYGRLFLAFVTANILTKYPFAMRELKKTLMSGSNMEKLIARTGWRDPQWEDTLRVIKNPKRERRIMLYFTLTELRYFTTHAINKEDIVNANFYLNILIQKFEQTCQMMGLENSVSKYQNSLMYEIKNVLNVILNHVMTFRGSHESVKVIQYIVKNDLPLEILTILVLLRSLRTQGYFQEALGVINSLNWDTLKGQDTLEIVEEIITLIHLRYPSSPHVLIGYIASIYSGKKQTQKHRKDSLSLLDDLGLLSAIEERTYTPRSISSMDLIQKANVDPHLCGFDLTASSLVAVYETVLKLLPKVLVTEEIINLLFERYLTVFSQTTHSEPIFAEKEVSDAVVVVLLKHLLLENPQANDMKFYQSTSRYAAAKNIAAQFLEKIEVPNENRSSYMFDILISVALLKHQDYEFASRIVRFSRMHNVPFSFNQIYPFIIYHYGRNEFSMAHQWYAVLTKHGINASASPVKELYRIARELGWSVNGFAYRKQRIHKNMAKKNQMVKIRQEPIVLIESDDLQTVEDEVTDELISGDNKTRRVADFGDELNALLQEASLHEDRITTLR